MRTRFSFAILSLAGVALTSMAAFAGELETLDGRRLLGDVTLTTDGKISVKPASGQSTVVAVNELSFSSFADSLKTTDPVGESKLPAPWQAADIGKVLNPGATKYDDGLFQSAAWGWGIWSPADSCHFVYQTLEGDGQVIAQVTLPPEEYSTAVAGVMLRSTLDPTATFAAATMGPSDDVRLMSRPWPDRDKSPLPSDAPSTRRKGWVRLTRAGDVVTAYRSDDGRSWTEVASRQVALGEKVLAGLEASTLYNSIAANVAFGHFSVLPGNPKVTGLRTPLPPTGVMLADGTGLPGTVTALAEGKVTLTAPDGKSTTYPTDEVAWVFCRPSFPDLTKISSDANAGALLKGGDFIQGDVGDMVDGQLTVTSIMFGPRTLDFANEVTALAFRVPANWNGWHVRLRTGVIHSGADLKVTADKVVLDKSEFPIADIDAVFAPQPAAATTESTTRP